MTGRAGDFWGELAKLFPGQPATVTAEAFGGPYVLVVGGYTIKAECQLDLLDQLHATMAAAGQETGK